MKNGSMILYNRKKVKYRKDGYCWKKRKDGKTTREDHMKLKVQGVESGSINLPPCWEALPSQVDCRALFGFCSPWHGPLHMLTSPTVPVSLAFNRTDEP
ncbi:hypothetical protein DNTS_003512 [Danionella cerebrum]|uniref:CG-1 domain-containing protein n=1 Tax=Danionella cerebrum TaxID=2873325 RepID=A0A553MTU6_9TELE|nr:hypothetical protein DNTS_003512 [Danionella translucida]